MSAAVTARDVSVAIKKQSILKGISFELPQQKIIGLLGPSGSGKTTLMRTIVGLQKIRKGTLTTFGQKPGAAKLRSRIAYMSQTKSIYSDLTVEENIQYFAKLSGAERARVNELLHEVELQPQADQLVDNLSGGQQARVSLAIALIAKPELLILDEPTVGLDPLLRNKLWVYFRELTKSGSTLLISSHVMDEAYRCDELLLMRQGHILAQGAAQSLQEKTNTYSIESAFIELIEATQ